MRPLGGPGLKAQEEIEQKGRPDLPADRLLGMTQEITDLQGLFELLEEHLDRPATLVEIADAGWSPLQVIGQKRHLDEFTIHLHSGHDTAHAFGIVPFRTKGPQRDFIIAQDVPGDPVLFADMEAHVVFGPGHPEHTPQM